MSIYYSATTKAFYHTELIPVSAMPTDIVLIDEIRYKQIMQDQTAGYVIAPDENGEPQLVQQGLTHATGTKASHDRDGNVISTTYVKTVNGNAPVNGNVNVTAGLDPNAVHKTGNETVAGTKTFTDDIVGNITGSAAQAGKLDPATDAGGRQVPVYFANGQPAACGDTLNVNISGNAVGAVQANQLNPSHDAGSSTRPIYFDGGQPALCGTSLAVDVTGNAGTADTLKTSRTIALSGGATGTATAFDGSGNISIPVTALDASKLTGTASVNTTGNADTATQAGKLDPSTDAGSSTRPVYFDNGQPAQCGTSLAVDITGNAKTASNGVIANTTEALTLGAANGSGGFIKFKYGRVDLSQVSGSTAAVTFTEPFPGAVLNIQVTPTRGANGGERWGDDYFCLFTQNITTSGFEIYSNHLNEVGSNGGYIDYLAIGY